ncbi:CPBP family intramembrane metalloprotease, partial [Candidatus Saccharibacteria bacterium]|nr:CPBP family intramembrane metalloprotease [Candidatus Saccharibacteria bacterium]
ESNKNFWDNGSWLVVVGWISWIVVAFFLGSIVVALGLTALLYAGVMDDKWSTDTATVTVVNTMVYVMILLIALLPWWVRQRRASRTVVDSKKSLAKAEATIDKKQKPRKESDKKKPAEKQNMRKAVAELVGLSRWPKWNDFSKFLTYIPVYYVTLLASSFTLTLVLIALLGGETATEILGQEQNVGFATTGQSMWQLVLIGFSLIIVAPVAEEMLTRGFLFGRLRKYLSFWPVAIIVSIVFALAHGQLNAGIMTFILSMFACGLREKTGAIWAAIWLHMLVNAVAFSLRFVVGVG